MNRRSSASTRRAHSPVTARAITPAITAMIAVLLSLVAAGCAAGQDAAPVDAPDAVITGPQGGAGQFAVECEINQFRNDDPIVKPGQPGESHQHVFFGAVGVHADSTYDELLAAATSCDQQLDTASYWSPILLDADGVPVAPRRGVAYYRAGAGVDPELIEPYPAGMTMVAADAHAIEAQPLSLASWSCGASPHVEPVPLDCRGIAELKMTVTFPDCWNGADVVSPEPSDPSRHVAYSHDGECPTEFKVHIPQLQFVVEYPAIDPDGVALTSGSPYSAHADFWNAWDQDKLEREVEHCLVKNLPCKIAQSSRTMG